MQQWLNFRNDPGRIRGTRVWKLDLHERDQTRDPCLPIFKFLAECLAQKAFFAHGSDFCADKVNDHGDHDRDPMAERKARCDEPRQKCRVDRMTYKRIDARRDQFMSFKNSGLQAPLFAEFLKRGYFERDGGDNEENSQ